MRTAGISLLFFFMVVVLLPSVSANPFTQKKAGRSANSGMLKAPAASTSPADPSHEVQVPAEPGVLMRITMTQQKIRAKMAGWIREAREGGSPMPLLWVLGTALVYGMVHSAGPGHGKAVALSYIFCFKPGVSRGLVFGNVLALSHGLSGVILVLAVKYIFEASMGDSLASVTRGTQIFSYSLITLLGSLLFVRSAREWIGPAKEKDSEQLPSEPSLLTALAMGMIPCPGVVMSMLFCISMGLTLFGVLTGLAISLGMAITLSCVVLAGIFGKGLLVRGGAWAGAGTVRVESCVEALAGLAVSVMGGAFLLASL